MAAQNAVLGRIGTEPARCPSMPMPGPQKGGEHFPLPAHILEGNQTGRTWHETNEPIQAPANPGRQETDRAAIQLAGRPGVGKSPVQGAGSGVPAKNRGERRQGGYFPA